MLSIEFILPYTKLAPTVEQVYNEHPKKNKISMRMSFISHDQVKSSEIKSDIVIARGLTALYLNQLLKGKFTVLEIPMTGYDVLRALKKGYMEYGNMDVALIAPESVIYGFEEQMKGVDSKVRTYEIDFNSDFQQVLTKAHDDGAGFMIGGNEVISIAHKLGYKGIRIDTGRQGIRQVFDEAWNIHISKLDEELKTSRFKAVIENIDEGIIACDSDKRITISNACAETLLGLPKAELIGKKLSEINNLFDNPPFESVSNAKTESFLKLKGVPVAMNRIPLRINMNFESGTIVLQKLDNIQKMEVASRSLASEKGLVANHVFSDIIGSSNKMRETKQLAMNYSQVNANVLLLGETGSGKEMFAQSIHNASERKNYPFVAVNCAALPESLLESELFGYVEGAFTGASRHGKIGLFELAHRGTLFLDEISEMSYSLQGRLLRVLEEKSVMKLGSDKYIPIDVRIIAASNQDINTLVKEKKFREDLFYRLDVLRLTIPPLRERINDIPEIMNHFIQHFDNKNRRINHMIDPAVFEILRDYSWPGNIRELRNLCERLSAIVFESIITVEALGKCFDFQKRDHSIAFDEKDTIVEAMRMYKGNKSKVAMYLKMDRSTLYRKLRHYDLLH